MRFPELFQHYSQTISLSPEDWEQLENLANPTQLKKGEVYLVPNSTVTEFAFIHKGLFKLSYVTNNGQESIKCFRREKELLSAYAEYIQNLPSRTHIQALEDAQLMTIKFSDFEHLIKINPAWMKLKLRITEEHFIIKDKREYDFLMRTALERYEILASENPDLLERIPQYMIANYLGVTPVALSRLLSTKKK